MAQRLNPMATIATMAIENEPPLGILTKLKNVFESNSNTTASAIKMAVSAIGSILFFINPPFSNQLKNYSIPTLALSRSGYGSLQSNLSAIKLPVNCLLCVNYTKIKLLLQEKSK